MRDEFLITRQGKQYVLFAGLLDEAHSRGLSGIDTELLQVPNETNGNTAICKATVTLEDGRIFSGIGDANPENVSRNISPHLIRMAETRAKARALRDAVNVGATALEELSDGDDAPPATRPQPARAAASSGRQQRPVRAVEEPAGQQEEAQEPPARERQSRQGRSGSAKARQSQVKLLRTLAVELRGENGVERLEKTIGKPLEDLTRSEADHWIDRLTPDETGE
jgi:hypothetical protein